jgi:GT2 family glycosyltransferase
MHRSVYDQVGGINESFKYAEDYDLCLRLSEVTKIQHLPKSLYSYRSHPDNISHQHPAEQSYYAYQAIAQALQRRELIDRSDLLDSDLLDSEAVQQQLSLLRKKGSMNSAASRLSFALGLSSTH